MNRRYLVFVVMLIGLTLLLGGIGLYNTGQTAYYQISDWLWNLPYQFPPAG